MASSVAFYPQTRLQPGGNDGTIRIDEVAERFLASKKFEDLKMLVRRVPPNPQPARPLKLVTDRALLNQRPIVAQSAMDASRTVARVDPRPKDTRRQHQTDR
jgi:hypothetical protein